VATTAADDAPQAPQLALIACASLRVSESRPRDAVRLRVISRRDTTLHMAKGRSSRKHAGGTPTAEAHVALLRGINVGGKNLLPMKELVQLFDAAGCRNPSTYIQSGNVIFDAAPSMVARLSATLERAIADRFGLRVPVVLRSAAELERLARANPFLTGRAEIDSLHLAFLADEPSAARVATLDPQRSPPDRFSVRGREIYLCFPNGVARSKLTNQYFDSKLATTCTVRNWKTVLKLVELASAR
jgi:uncharacterized protein (DUF1697 family)